MTGIRDGRASRTTTAWWFAAALTILVGLAAISFGNLRTVIESSTGVAHTHEVQTQLEQLLGALLEVESSQRGYLVSGDERDLDRSRRAAPAIQEHIDQLRALTADNPRQQRRVALLAPRIAARLAALRAAVAARRAQGPGAARRAVVAGRGPAEMEAISRLVGELRDEESALLVRRAADLRVSIRRTVLLIVLLTVLDGALFVHVYLRLTRETRVRQRIAEALRESEERGRLLIAGVTDYAIFMLDRDGRVASWNAGAERIKGYRADEIVGEHFSRFYLEEDVRQGKPTRALAVAAEAGRVEEEGWRVRKDGTRFWANVVVTAVRDETGRLRGFSKVTRDVTERRQTLQTLEERTRALEAAQEELVRTARLAVLGQLAGGVSHELRNPLGVIKNSVYYLKMVLPEDERARKHLAIVEREVATANRIVTALLDFARVRPPSRIPTTLNVVVRECLERTPVPETIAVALRLDDALPPVLIDPDQVGLVLGNLVTNAAQAMPAGGTLTIETAAAEGTVWVAVADTGSGIAADHLAKIFEPLFTTKARGIGLGLAVAKRLAEANDGTLTVESVPGRGSRFLLRFAAPAAHSPEGPPTI